MFSYQGRLGTLLNWFNSEHDTSYEQEETIADKRHHIDTYIQSISTDVSVTVSPFICFSFEDILSVSSRCYIDTIFVSANEHAFWRDFALPPIDLQLMARSPYPVFIVKSHDWYSGATILSAVEPLAKTKLISNLLIKLSKSRLI